MRGNGLLFLMLSIALQTASLAFGKRAALQMTEFTLPAIVANGFYLLSLACLALQAITWQLTLAKLPLTHAYAMMSVVYVNILLISAYAFHEQVTPAHIAGALLIIGGVVLVALGSRARSVP